MEKELRLAVAGLVLSCIGGGVLEAGILIGILPAILALIFAVVVLYQKKYEKSRDFIAKMAIAVLILSIVEIFLFIILLIVVILGLGEDALATIGTLFMLLCATVLCIVMGVDNFKRIYQTRYGKNHIELEGKVIGEDTVITRGGRSKCPVMEFYYQDKRYAIADETYIIFYDYKVGDVMTVCFNPDYNENIVIIKRGKFNFQTTIWLQAFVVALMCIVAEVIGVIGFIKTYF